MRAGRTVTPASLALTDVQAAVDAAVDGDTVTLPAGTSPDWTGLLTVDGKNLTIQGAGMDDAGTTLVSAAANGRAIVLISIASDATMRLTGLRIHQKTQADTPGVIRVGGTATVHLKNGMAVGGIRVDHVRWTAETTTVANKSYVLATADWVTGVIDHNFIDYPATPTTGAEVMDLSQPARPGVRTGTVVDGAVQERGNYSWTQPYVWGGGLAANGDLDALYLEDNIIHKNGIFLDQLSGGSRVVARHNTSWGALSGHGMETGNNSGARAAEYYNNKLDAVVQTNFWVHAVRSGGAVIFNERHSNWQSSVTAASAVYLYRAVGTQSEIGPGDGTNFFDLNARGVVQGHSPIYVPVDARLGAVYATSTGGATAQGSFQWTLAGLDCGPVADGWRGFTLRNATLAPDETFGGQVAKAPPNTWTLITRSGTGSPCVLGIGTGAASNPAFTIGPTDVWELRAVTQFLHVPGSGPLDSMLQGTLGIGGPPRYVTGTPPQRWANQQGEGLWEWANLRRPGLTGDFAPLAPFGCTSGWAAPVVPGGCHSGAVKPGYPTQPATPDTLRIGADGDPEAIQAGQPGAATQAWGAPYPHPLVSGAAAPPGPTPAAPSNLQTQ